jgi:hypothetical protein
MFNDLKCISFINAVNFLKTVDRILCHFMFFKTGELQFGIYAHNVTQKYAVFALLTSRYLCYAITCSNFCNCTISLQRRAEGDIYMTAMVIILDSDPR